MALCGATIDNHVAQWSAQFGSSHRAKWPKYLFHHTPLENVAGILTGGQLRCRDETAGLRGRDVAGAEVIAHRERAHRFVRFYFRPRTPTQYRIEGIMNPQEAIAAGNSHAPVLYMLVFDARKVLQLPGIRFSDGNMQSDYATDEETEEFFQTIPFEKVYHQGGTGGDRAIIHHRCAEVLSPAPVNVTQNIQWVYCRSRAEQQMLLHFLGEDAPRWEPRTVVSDDLGVFEKRYTYVEDISLSHQGISIRLHPRSDWTNIDVEVSAWDRRGTQVVAFRNDAMAAIPPGHQRWLVEQQLMPGRYLVEARLENQLAYRAFLRLTDAVF